jgi:hypothetical protein
VNGLTTIPLAPFASAWVRFAYVPAPVTRTTGRLGCEARTVSSRSRPESPGITMSETTSETEFRERSSSPASARSASTVSKPASSSTSTMSPRTIVSSSITRMRSLTPRPRPSEA